MNTTSSCDSISSSSNSQNFISSWENEKSPKVCGHALFSRLLSPKKDARSPLSKTCMSPKKAVSFDAHRKYRPISGSIKSPDTESSTSSSEKSKDDSGGSVGPPFIVQFNPDDCNDFEGEDEQRSVQKSLSVHSRKQSHPHSSGSRSTMWSISLPSVAEERSMDSEEPMSPLSRQGQETVRNVGLAEEMTQENMDILLSMRSLILKQQEALKQLSEENSKFRQELAKAQSSLRAISQDNLEQKSLNASLSSANDTLELEMSQLRNEAKTLQDTLDSTKSEQSLTLQFENLMSGDSFSERENISVKSGLSDVEPFPEAKRSSIFFPDIAESTEENAKAVTETVEKEKAVLTETNSYDRCQTPSPFTLRGNSWRADSCFEGLDQIDDFETTLSVQDQESPQSPPSRVTKWLADKQPEATLFASSRDASELISKGAKWLAQSRERLEKEYSSSETSQSSVHTKEKSAATREEISLFKERLASIQQRRAQRQVEVARPRGPVVRFGENTFQ